MLISGGDGLTLAPKLLEAALRGLREIPHVEIVRIGSRVPVFMPQRIDDELCEMLAKYHPLWLNIHVNHPNEITPELPRACDKLSRAGIPLGNQSVLLAGVNDCVHTQRELVQRLVENRVRPYYLYQCDLVEGAGHFRTPVGKGLEIIEGLRGHTSGYAVPQFIVDAPGGGGKIPVMPNYVVSYSDHKVILRNYEGYITTYEEPAEYQPHDPSTCQYCQNPRPEPGQEGITGLLDGKRMWIEPAGFQQVHERGAEGTHRLKDPSKWVPLGVGRDRGQVHATPSAPCRCSSRETPDRRAKRPRRVRAGPSFRSRAGTAGPSRPRGPPRTPPWPQVGTLASPVDRAAWNAPDASRPAAASTSRGSRCGRAPGRQAVSRIGRVAACARLDRRARPAPSREARRAPATPRAPRRPPRRLGRPGVAAGRRRPPPGPGRAGWSQRPGVSPSTSRRTSASASAIALVFQRAATSLGPAAPPRGRDPSRSSSHVRGGARGSARARARAERRRRTPGVAPSAAARARRAPRRRAADVTPRPPPAFAGEAGTRRPAASRAASSAAALAASRRRVRPRRPREPELVPLGLVRDEPPAAALGRQREALVGRAIAARPRRAATA